MSDNKITQDQLEPNVMEELESGIGDLSTLSTENKDSLVAAVTEIYGKNVIAEAIGEPLAVTDTFSEMGNEINSLLSSFKTNMMNSGVTVESGDKFKQLIEKIKGLTEGEGNKGIQFAEGVCDNITIGVNTATNWNEYIFEQDFGFIPSRIIFQSESTKLFALNRDTRIVIDSHYHYSEDKCWYMTAYNSAQGLDNYRMYISNISSTGFSLFIKSDSSCFFNSNTWYAIGVGEEDTTLRDSLADILENKGVDVTEEDDMASLITKVDGLSSNLDWMNNQFTMTVCAPYSTTEDTPLNGSSVEIYNDIAYVMSGNTMYTYNFKENTWSKLSKTKPTTAYYSSSAIIDGKIYYINGSQLSSPYNLANAHIEYYDIANDTWTTSTAKPSRRFYSAATAVYDKKIYMIGGSDGDDALSSVYCYDTVNDTCVKLKDAPIEMNAARAVTVGEYIYMMGGGGYGSNVYASYAYNYCYDPKNDSWTKKTDIPMETANPVVVAKDDKIYCMFGGSRSYNSGTYLCNKICCYNVADDSWTDTTTYITAHNCSYGQYGDYILLVGGYYVPYLSNLTDSSSNTTAYYIPRLIKIN